MPLGLFIDVKGSQDLEIRRRKTIIDKLEEGRRALLNFPEHVIPLEPALTAGDMLEIVATEWYPLTYIVHYFLRFQFPFRGGLGTGPLHIRKEKVDESDGPVLWAARRALDQAKKKHQKIRLEWGKDTSRADRVEGMKTFLTIGMLLNMTKTQREYAFAWLWKDKSITEISTNAQKSKASVSKTLKRANAYVLQDLLKFHPSYPNCIPSLGKASSQTSTIDDHINYITDVEARKAAKRFIDEVKTWEGVDLDPIQSDVSMKVHGKVFAYFTPRRDAFQIRTYSKGGREWETIAEVQAQDELEHALQKTKERYKQTR